MRLLKASTIELHEFAETELPRYAILSHRWGEQEVSLQDLKNILPRSGQNSKGYDKIKRACALAERYELEYIWIDTCCIDKTSSAELSEAINSMYRWYAQSVLCFAHLADIELRTLARTTDEEFVDSKWFQRGWTLQELLAPDIVLFFDANWQEIGTRSALAPYIATATKIGPEFLRQERDVHKASIAQRMSWASLRKTTRVEDIAYCLMGLFDVNMPLLYGEGKKAFLRLQQELIRTSSDESIYAWEPSNWEKQSRELSGMLASEPEYFIDSGSVVSIELPSMRQTPFSITNRGIAMTLPSVSRSQKNMVVDQWVSYIADLKIGGGYEIPMACADVKDIEAPLRLCIKEDTNGSYARDHASNGFQFFTNYNANGLEVKTFHVPLSSSLQYSRQSSRDNVVPKWVTIQLRPAAQTVLRVLGASGGKAKLYTTSEEPPLWQCKNWGQDFALDFEYRGRLSIHLIYKDNRIGLHVEHVCKENGCKEYWKNKTRTNRLLANTITKLTTSESLMTTSNILTKSSICAKAYDQNRKVPDNDGQPAVIGNSLWEECTYIDWGGCQSRPLDDDSFLWLSTRTFDDPHVTRKWIMDFDISPVDRREVFFRRD